MGKYDGAGKKIISRYSQAWVEWLLRAENVAVETELSGEFQFFARNNDSLLKVNGPDGPFIVLTELQFVYDDSMDKRLAAYKFLAEYKYELDVFVTIIFFLPPKKGTVIPTAYHKVFKGQTSRQDYQVIKLWELSAEAVLNYGNVMLLPFVPLMKGGGTEQIVRQCAQRIRQLPSAEAAELETYLAVFAARVLSIEVIRQILRWNMDQIMQSPVIQEVIAYKKDDWFAEGKEEGEKIGVQKGEKTAYLRSLYQILIVKFGVVFGQFDAKLTRLDAPSLQKLVDVALVVDNLDQFLDQLLLMMASQDQQDGV